ncbi:MAG: cyclic nucleotide-binding domain-containing protein [Candidatus Cloacimonadales bacterium]|nr:cyclic nucleotide-binding domain-containing protein [Candidatus Cloacimonadales bacterium]
MDLAFLKKITLFKELANKELEFFASKLKLVKFKQGELIIKENEIGDEMYILYQGEVNISKKMSMIDEQEKIDKTFICLDASMHVFFGEVGILGEQKRTANCQAKTDCQLYSINHKIFMAICNEQPQIGFKVMHEISLQLSRLLEKTNQDVLKLTTALIYALKG